MRHLLARNHFFLTSPLPCPYLEGRTERKLFTHLGGERADRLNQLLTVNGFRRSQNIAYRPSCEGCSACISVRIDVNNFRWTSRFERQWRKGQKITRQIVPAIPSDEQYLLFRKYLSARHYDGGMTEMSIVDYAMMVEDTPVDTVIVEYRLRESDKEKIYTAPLKAIALSDILPDGLSMIYSFFDPDYKSVSLGTLMILDHIHRAQKMKLNYVYLGYWVQDSAKMRYKEQFQPLQYLGPAGWSPNPPSNS